MRFPLNRCLPMLSVLCICGSLANAQIKRPPLTDSELLALVAGNALSENIVQEIASRGLVFRPDDHYRSWIQTAGADAAVMAALGKAKITSSGQGASNDGAKDQLLQHLATAGKLIRSKQYEDASRERVAPPAGAMAGGSGGLRGSLAPCSGFYRRTHEMDFRAALSRRSR